MQLLHRHVPSSAVLRCHVSDIRPSDTQWVHESLILLFRFVIPGMFCLCRLNFWSSLKEVGGPKFSSVVVPGNHWTMLFGERSKAIGDIISSIVAIGIQ
jgi:hypothetical protein